MRRTTHQTSRHARWTPLERVLIVCSLLLMLGSVCFEAYLWVNPRPAPAAPRRQEEATPTAAAENPTGETASATAAPETATPTTAPTDVPSAEATSMPTTEPPTATTEPPTATQVVDYGATTTPTSTPLPTLAIGSVPLILEKTASGRTVRPGSQFSYFLHIRTASEGKRTIEVRDTIDDQLEVIEASSTSGTCSTSNLVVCVLNANRDTPAEVIINVRVRDSIAPGTTLVSQALARDDQRETAASERVTVTVAGATSQVIAEPVQATALPTATVPPTEKPKPAPSRNENPAPPAPSVPPATEIIAPQVTTAELAAADAPTAQATEAPTVQAEAPTAQAQVITAASPEQQATPGLPPTLAPIEGGSGAGPVNPSTASPQLPHTGASLPSFGFGIGLLGLALTLHGTRRVRRADARFSGESTKLGKLGLLVEDASDLQHTTVDEIERMRKHSEEMRKMLER